MTRLARTYVVTGDSRYERMYWDVLAVRRGAKARPDGRKITLRSLMEQLGFTAAEFAKLQEAENNSNGLVRTETIAMNAMKGKFEDEEGKFTRIAELNTAMAQRIMHDEKYHAAKEVIMRPIDDFDGMLDQRTKATVDAYLSREHTAGSGCTTHALRMWTGVLYRSQREHCASDCRHRAGRKHAAGFQRFDAGGCNQPNISHRRIAPSGSPGRDIGVGGRDSHDDIQERR